jgi:hypothetical protein
MPRELIVELFKYDTLIGLIVGVVTMRTFAINKIYSTGVLIWLYKLGLYILNFSAAYWSTKYPNLIRGPA